MANNEWARLIEEIMNCRKCPLHKTRKNPVPGDGDPQADIVFVGEAPGEREDLMGKPFVGAAGKFLDHLLGLVGLDRSKVYITNIVKCRPPGNRDPREEEIEACIPYLWRQIKLIKPKMIVALGRHAARTLYGRAGLKWTNMTRDHGRIVEAVLEGNRVLLAVTYHPAAALYNPRLRSKLEEDFKKIFEEYGRKVKEGSATSSKRSPNLLDFFGKR